MFVDVTKEDIYTSSPLLGGIDDESVGGGDDVRGWQSDLEASASAERRHMSLSHKAELDDERTANEEVRAQLRKVEEEVRCCYCWWWWRKTRIHELKNPFVLLLLWAIDARPWTKPSRWWAGVGSRQDE